MKKVPIEFCYRDAKLFATFYRERHTSRSPKKEKAVKFLA